MTRLQSRISSLGRAAGRQSLYDHTVSVSGPPAPSKRPQAALCTPSHGHSVPFPLPPAHSASQPASVLHQTSGRQQISSVDSSWDFPPSLKATLREALSQQPWEASSASVSSFPDTEEHSWQRLSATEASVVSDVSFDPLTYVLDQREAGSTLEGDESRRESASAVEGQEDMSSLTGMLRFVNQTLAMQEDPSAWTCTSPAEA